MVRDGDLPVSDVVDLVIAGIPTTVAVHRVNIRILLVEARYDLGQVVVVLL